MDGEHVGYGGMVFAVRLDRGGQEMVEHAAGRGDVIELERELRLGHVHQPGHWIVGPQRPHHDGRGALQQHPSLLIALLKEAQRAQVEQSAAHIRVIGWK